MCQLGWVPTWLFWGRFHFQVLTSCWQNPESRISGLRSPFPWCIGFFIFKPTILMLQTYDFPFCHISLTPAREHSLLLLAQVIRLGPPENQVNLVLKYIAWLIFAKALLLCNIIYWYVPEIRPQTSQHGVWRLFC